MNCRLLEMKWLYRKFLLETADGNYRIEYIGRGFGNERVVVNGKFAAGGTSLFWFIPRFEFDLGTTAAVLHVRVWPWLKIRSMRLTVDGREVYAG